MSGDRSQWESSREGHSGDVPISKPRKFGTRASKTNSDSVRERVLGSSTYLTGAGVNAKCRDGVVDVEALSVVTRVPLTGPTIDELFRTTGSGFFSDCRYIVTTACLVTLPNPVTLPDGTVVGARLPAPTDTPVLAIRANHIFVRVYDVNGGKCSYLYEATLIGVDLESNVAVLKIDDTLQFNKKNPTIEDATFIKWGKSRKYGTGSDVFNISNANLTVRKFEGGYVRDNDDKDVSQKFYESVDTSIPFQNGMVGSPLLDRNGNAIAIVTGQSFNIDSSDVIGETDPTELEAADLVIPFLPKSTPTEIVGVAFGVAQHVASRIVRSFINADQGRCNKRVQIVKDPVGNFFIYRKGWLNVSLSLVSTETWLNHNLTVNTTTSPPTFTLTQPFCTKITGYYVNAPPPGGAANPLNAADLALTTGDIILELACQELGECGTNFYSVLYKFKPGDEVRLTFARASEGYANAHCAFIRLPDPPPNQGPLECSGPEFFGEIIPPTGGMFNSPGGIPIIIPPIPPP